jgi:hemerythrin-like domain-containing protein
MPALLRDAAEARLVAAGTLETFRGNVFSHHADEEKELFPAVLRSARPGEEAQLVRQMTQRLVQEHRSLEAQWKALEPEVRAASHGKPAVMEPGAVEQLVVDYLAHARFEEEHFLPLAADILSRNMNHVAALDMALHLRHAVPAIPAYI